MWATNVSTAFSSRCHSGTQRGSRSIMKPPTAYRTARCFALAPIVALTACVGAKISTPQQVPPLSHPVQSIAFSPSGGVMADAVGTELFNQGFNIFDTRQTSSLMIRYNLNELEVMRPSALADEGIDAFLVVRTVAGYDGKPESVSVRAVSPRTGEVVAALTWQTGHGGQAGSILDRAKRKGMVDAAAQIGKALAKQLRR